MRNKIIATGVLATVVAGLTISSAFAANTDDMSSRNTMKEGKMGMQMGKMHGEKSGKEMEFGMFHDASIKKLIDALPTDTQTALKTLQKTQMDEMKTLHETFVKGSSQDTTTRDANMAKMKVLQDTHFTQLKTLLGENSEIIKAITAQKTKMEQKMSEQKQNMDAVNQLKTTKTTEIANYKALFNSQIGDKLSKIQDDKKIEQLLEQLSKKYAQVSADTTLSTQNKEILQLKIIALQDILKSKINESSLNINELIK